MICWGYRPHFWKPPNACKCEQSSRNICGGSPLCMWLPLVMLWCCDWCLTCLQVCPGDQPWATTWERRKLITSGLWECVPGRHWGRFVFFYNFGLHCLYGGFILHFELAFVCMCFHRWIWFCSGFAFLLAFISCGVLFVARVVKHWLAWYLHPFFLDITVGHRTFLFFFFCKMEARLGNEGFAFFHRFASVFFLQIQSAS